MTFKQLKLCTAVPELKWLLNAHGEDGVRFRVISSHGFPDIRRNIVYHSDLLHSPHLQVVHVDIYSECLTLKLEFSNLIVFLHFAMSDKRPCVVVLIGNDDDQEVTLACACARRLYDVLKQEVCGRPVCGDPILLLNKSKEEIMEGIQEAVRLVKDHDASWLAIYYAGHSFWDDLTKEIIIEPKADGGGMRLEKQVKQTVHNAKLEKIKTTIFVDSCLNKSRDKAEDEAKDDQLGDSKKLRGNTFLLATSCEIDESVRDGCLFARAIERCARKNLKQRGLKEHVEELACQLSFGRLCPWSCLEELEEVDDMVLTEEQREPF